MNMLFQEVTTKSLRFFISRFSFTETSNVVIRFLRNMMDLTQEELARKLGVDVQTTARYEKGQTAISGPADRLLRHIFVLSTLPQSRRLATLDEIQLATEERQIAGARRRTPSGENAMGWSAREGAHP